MRTYGTLKLKKDGKVWKLGEIEPHVVISLKANFRQIPKWQTSPFTFNNTPEICHTLEWFTQRYPLAISPEDLAVLQKRKYEYLQTIDSLERILRPDYKAGNYQLKLPIRDYQAQALELFFNRKALLCGDDVGLGKTLIGIAASTKKELLPILVVVQTHLPTQWRDEIGKFTDCSTHIIKGRKPYSLPPADFYVIRYSCLAAWADTFSSLKIINTVVFDEVQELRISGSDKFKAAELIVSTAEYRLGLSATPIFNYGEEIYNILNLLNEGCLGEYPDFMREWAGYSKIIKDPKALGTYLRENFLMLRRTREDVKKELPEINKIVHTVDFDAQAVKSLEEIVKKLAVSVTSGTFLERGRAARELDIRVRQATGVSKARYVAEYVKVLLENGEPVLLAGWHRDVYDIWLEELAKYKPVLYTGTESEAQKNESKRKFTSGESQLMIISLRSGIGLDGLQHRSSVVVFGELDWSPAVHHQVEGRLNRDGQMTQVTSIYLVSDSGSDPLMVELLGLKASQSNDILNPLNEMTKQYSDESRIKLLAENLLKKMNTTQEPQEPQ